MAIGLTKRVRPTDNTPVLSLVVSGSDDCYRLLAVLMRAQVEFQDRALHAWPWLRETLGADWFDDLDRRLTRGEYRRFAERSSTPLDQIQDT